MYQQHSTTLKQVTASNPCVHCGRIKGCYTLGDDVSGCRKGVEPATGWYKTEKVDKDGTPYYGTLASQKRWLEDGKEKRKQGKAKPKGDKGKVVKEKWYTYDIFEPDSTSHLLSHLGKVKLSPTSHDVKRWDFENGSKKVKQRTTDSRDPYWSVNPDLRPYTGLYCPQHFFLELHRFQSLTNEELSKEIIFIPEGEKCVDALSKVGLTAFCSLGGSKWRESDTQWLLSLIKYHNGSERENWQEHCPTIVLCPDMDKPGIEHSTKVFEALKDTGVPDEKIQWFLPYPVDKLSDVPLSGGEDVADMLSDNPNLTVEDFLNSLKTTKECHFLEANLIGLMDYIWGDVEDDSSPLTKRTTPFLSSLFNQVTTEIDWLVQDLLPSKSAVVLTGNPGVGKSVSFVDLAAAVAGGTTWLGKECKQGKVLILNNDQSLDILIRYAKKRIKDDVSLQNEIAVLDGWKADEENLKYLEEDMKEYQFSLVIMDSVRQCICHPLGIDQNAPESGYKLKEVSDIVTKAGGCFIAIHHETKSNDAKGTNKSAGSTSIISNADAHWRLSKGSDSDKVYLKMPKTRGYKAVEMAYEVDFDNDAVCVPVEKSGDESGSDSDTSELGKKEPTVSERVLDYLVSGEEVSKEELLEALHEEPGDNTTDATLQRILSRLVKDKKVVRIDTPTPENPKRKLYKLCE